MTKQPVIVAVTGAAGQIGYALLFRIASGEMFGQDVPVHLNLLELPEALPALEGVSMELADCAFPLLKGVTVTADLKQGFQDADWALLIGSVPRKVGMERGELLGVNGKIFAQQGKILDAVAKKQCKVLVVGNPCNTNAYIAKSVCKNIVPENFFAMTALDEARAQAALAKKSEVAVEHVKNIAIWGNHSATQYPDFANAMICGKPASEIIFDEKWLREDFIQNVQTRGAEIIKARGKSSAASAAHAVIQTVRHLIAPIALGEFFSLGVCSDGSYDIPKGLIFSFPVVSNGQGWSIVQGIRHNDFSKERIQKTLNELLEEKKVVERGL